MNKFLEKYPQMWIPKIGDKIIIIEVPTMSIIVEYMRKGLVGTLDSQKNDMTWVAVFDINPDHYPMHTYYGRCLAGYPFINFIPDINEK